MKVSTAAQAQQYLKKEVPTELQELIKRYLIADSQADNSHAANALLKDAFQYAATKNLFFDIVNVSIMMFRVANGESKFEDSIIVCTDESFDFSNARIFA